MNKGLERMLEKIKEIEWYLYCDCDMDTDYYDYRVENLDNEGKLFGITIFDNGSGDLIEDHDIVLEHMRDKGDNKYIRSDFGDYEALAIFKLY
jgi:hypothetical protein